MNKLRFIKDEGTEFYLELREKVDQYFNQNTIAKTGNTEMHLKIVLYFALVICFYVLMITSHALPVFYICYLLFGFVIILGIFNISHDACHNTAVKSRFWNNLVFNISFNLSGSNAYIWRQNHRISHHIYTNVDGRDSEIIYNSLIRLSESQKLKWYHRYQHVYAPLLYLFITLNWIVVRELQLLYGKSYKTIGIRVRRTELLKLIFYKGLYFGYMIFLPMYLLPFPPIVIASAFILNHFICSLFFVSTLGLAHLSDLVDYPHPDKNGVFPMSWPKLQLSSAIDFAVDSSFCNRLIGGNNVHTLHHLLPNICHVHYKHIVPVVRNLCSKYGVKYMEMPYRAAIISHFRFLKRLGRDNQQIIKGVDAC